MDDKVTIRLDRDCVERVKLALADAVLMYRRQACNPSLDFYERARSKVSAEMWETIYWDVERQVAL